MQSCKLSLCDGVDPNACWKGEQELCVGVHIRHDDGLRFLTWKCCCHRTLTRCSRRRSCTRCFDVACAPSWRADLHADLAAATSSLFTGWKYFASDHGYFASTGYEQSHVLIGSSTDRPISAHIPWVEKQVLETCQILQYFFANLKIIIVQTPEET